MQGRGAILRVDLSTQKISREPLSPELGRRFLGGEGINSWLLWEHFLKVDPKIDPLNSDNVLIAGIGPLGATSYGVGAKMKWTFKSPLTNMFGDSVSGDAFGANLRWAGYDHLVITGQAERPVYLWIDDDSVEIRDAAHLWGRDADEVDELLKEELGEDGIEIACIGRAGENLVAFSAITVSRHRAAGRVGGGCVMGSKNLKAIAVRGTKGLEIHDPQGLIEAADTLTEALFSETGERDFYYAGKVGERDERKRYGTYVLVEKGQRGGFHPFRNGQYSVVPKGKYEKLSARWYTENLGVGPMSCLGCIRGCGGWYRIKGNESPAARRYAGTIGTKPEYATIASFGMATDIPDMSAVSYFKDKCNIYSMDAIDMGVVCGFLMELWEKGIVTREDTADWFGEPVSLEWGNYEAVEKVIDSVAMQSNKLGLLFRDGLYKAAQRIEEIKNAPALKYAIYGKGGSTFICNWRHFTSSSVNMAVASRGADHLKARGTLDKINRPDISTYYFGTPDGADPSTLTLKGASSAASENHTALINCLGICVFPVALDPILYSPEMFAGALLATTGVAMSGDELRAAGERTVNLEKAFNSRVGYRREDDTLCERWMKEPMRDGPGKGWKTEDYLEQLKDEYYEHHGWDKETSLQTRKKLKELGLDDVAKVLKKENAVV